MDYQYLNQAQQPYQFVGFPPTPTHTNSGTDEFSNGSPETFDQFPFDGFTQFTAGTPTPSSTQSLTAQPPTPQEQHALPAADIHDAAFNVSPTGSYPLTATGNDTRPASNSDEEAKPESKRKAQNRAAQRAFRERKEQYVRQLKERIEKMEVSSATMTKENERLRRDVERYATENEILRATSLHQAAVGAHGALGVDHREPATGPLQYSPIDFYSDLLEPHENKTPAHRIVHSPSGGRLLAAGSTWDFIIAHPLYKSGMVDVGAVSEKLKDLAKCDGQGPVFEEKDILNAIEMSIASGSDELL